MRKLLLLIALGFVMLSSCNNGKTKGADEEIDSIALRAKKDTILSFNGHTLGKTSIKEFLASDGDVAASIYDKDATITVDKWTYHVKYGFDGNTVKSVKKEGKIIETVKVNTINIQVGDWQYDKIDSTDIRRIVKLYTSRYGQYSYFDANNGDSPVLFPDDKVDSLSHDFYLKTFICKGKGKIVWEWANCSISIYPDPEECFIDYSSFGAKDRLKEEKKLESQAKHQDI